MVIIKYRKNSNGTVAISTIESATSGYNFKEGNDFLADDYPTLGDMLTYVEDILDENNVQGLEDDFTLLKVMN